jgi:hypothetical protein
MQPHHWLVGLRDAFEDQEVRASGTGIPDPVTWRDLEMGSSRLTYPLIEVAEQCGKYLFNPIPDHVIVFFERSPIDAIVAKRRLGDAAHDRDFGFQMLPRRSHEARRRMHHRHAVFHGGRLSPAALDIDVASGKAR